MNEIPDRVIARFLELIDRDWDPDDCWPWPMSIGSHGYGQIGWMGPDGRGMVLAHRIAWLAAGNDLPEDLTVHHKCYRRDCVNVRHLMLLPNEANAADNGNARKKACKRGHAFDAVNTYIDPKGHRRCRQCMASYRRGRVAA